MQTIAIIQARLSSTRLRGKVLKNLLGKTVLSHVLTRLKCCREIDQIIVATTIDPGDDALVIWCQQHDVLCFRGDRENVLSRFYACAVAQAADVIVRVTSDNPLLDPEVVDQVIVLRREQQADYAANNLIKSFPHGLDVEVLTFKALEASHQQATEWFEKEHVTQYIRHRPEQYTLVNFRAEGEWYNIRITLDEDDDWQLIETVMRILGQDARLQDIITLFSELPALKKINAEAKQRHAAYNQQARIV